MSTHDRVTATLACLLVLAEASCASDKPLGIPQVPAPRPVAWVVSPDSLVLAIGDTARVTIALIDRLGDTLDMRQSVEGQLIIAPECLACDNNPPRYPVRLLTRPDSVPRIVIPLLGVVSGSLWIELKWGYYTCTASTELYTTCVPGTTVYHSILGSYWLFVRVLP